jgi:hypothetical protein
VTNRFQTRLSISTCATTAWKITWEGNPLLVLGTVGWDQKFHMTGLMLSDKERKQEYAYLMNSINDALPELASALGDGRVTLSTFQLNTVHFSAQNCLLFSSIHCPLFSSTLSTFLLNTLSTFLLNTVHFSAQHAVHFSAQHNSTLSTFQLNLRRFSVTDSLGR